MTRCSSRSTTPWGPVERESSRGSFTCGGETRSRRTRCITRTLWTSRTLGSRSNAAAVALLAQVALVSPRPARRAPPRRPLSKLLAPRPSSMASARAWAWGHAGVRSHPRRRGRRSGARPRAGPSPGAARAACRSPSSAARMRSSASDAARSISTSTDCVARRSAAITTSVGNEQRGGRVRPGLTRAATRITPDQARRSSRRGRTQNAARWRLKRR